ncbi:hypothetical protein Patl1_16398 [Pistacia atlantica]|uniref:Uncharacterized protein n=1 Tax=Pistacia atlantica TaxID=434234 RepID=A0ACC1B7Z8_9ROSI|nr:hypothetical protein Patl1_16398 [Pistacia atlantica]
MSVFLEILGFVFGRNAKDKNDRDDETSKRNSSVESASSETSVKVSSSLSCNDLPRQSDPTIIYYYEDYLNLSISNSTAKEPNAASLQSNLRRAPEVSQSSAKHTSSSSSSTQSSSFSKLPSCSHKPFLSSTGAPPSSSNLSVSSSKPYSSFSNSTSHSSKPLSLPPKASSSTTKSLSFSKLPLSSLKPSLSSTIAVPSSPTLTRPPITSSSSSSSTKSPSSSLGQSLSSPEAPPFTFGHPLSSAEPLPCSLKQSPSLTKASPSSCDLSQSSSELPSSSLKTTPPSKPTLSALPFDSRNQHTKDKCMWVPTKVSPSSCDISQSSSELPPSSLKTTPPSKPTLFALPFDSRNQHTKDKCMWVPTKASPSSCDLSQSSSELPPSSLNTTPPSKPTLSALPFNSRNQHTKGKCMWVPTKASLSSCDLSQSSSELPPSSLKTTPPSKPTLSALPFDSRIQHTTGKCMWVPTKASPSSCDISQSSSELPPSSLKTTPPSKPTLSALPFDSRNQHTTGKCMWVPTKASPSSCDLSQPSSELPPSSLKTTPPSKPTLSALPFDSRNQHTKDKYMWVPTKGSPSSCDMPQSSSELPPSSLKTTPPSKPTLSALPFNSRNQHTKAIYMRVPKGTSPNYMIPNDIEDLIKNDIVPNVLKKPLSPSTYKDYFAALLHAEDFYIEKWSGFQLSNVTLELHEAAIYKKSFKDKFDEKDDKVFVAFKIDSVPERRPFLLSRDFVYARPAGNESKFQGLIYRVVKSDIVLVEFEEDFYSQHHSDCKYDISFSFNRVCLKRAHQAIAAASDPLFQNYLFPDCDSRKNDPESKPILKRNNYLDSDQFLAVHQILNFQGSPPYLVEGPLSVTDRQLSKTGMVVLMEEIPVSDMFRANAAFREINGVPDDILPLSLYDGECFSCPSVQKLREFRVIFSTFASSFRLRNEGVTAGHFSHIFLVDASSATEPETLIALSNLANESTSVIVTGAPRKQPSWVRSDIARKNGLRRSYFERLREHNTYMSFDPMFISMLNSNQRIR